MIIVCNKILRYLYLKSHSVVQYFPVKALLFLAILVITRDGQVYKQNFILKMALKSPYFTKL